MIKLKKIEQIKKKKIFVIETKGITNRSMYAKFKFTFKKDDNEWVFRPAFITPYYSNVELKEILKISDRLNASK